MGLFGYSSTATLIFTLLVIRVNSQQTLTLYREAFTNGEAPLELNVDNCTSSLPTTHLETISHGNFTVNCALFYDRADCTGNSVQIEKVTHHHHHQNSSSNSNSSLMNWKLAMTKSIGPCDNDHPTNCTETRDPMPVVELFENADFKGRVVTMTLDHWTCYEIPASLKRKVSSIRMKADVCIELHSKSQCEGEMPLRIRRNAPPTAVNLVDWGWDDQTVSVSLCGLECRRKQNHSRISTKTKSDLDPVPKCPHITIFDEPNLTGNAKHLVLNQDCINLEGDWEGVAKSIYLQKECAILHTHFDCGTGNENSAGGWHHLQLGTLNRTASMGYNLNGFNMEGLTRSVGRCIGIKPFQPLIPIFVIVGLALLSSGVLIAWCVNCVVRKRDQKERQILIYHDKPS